MGIKNENSDYFDDDFEVTYEEDIPVGYHTSDKHNTSDRHNTTDTVFMDTSRLAANSGRSAGYSRYKDEDYNDDRYGNSRYDDDDYDDDYDYSRRSAPARKTRKAASRKVIRHNEHSIYRTAQRVIRLVSFLLSVGTLGVLGYNFWIGSAPYGNVETILTEQNLTLISYAAFAGLLLFFEFCAVFWSLTKSRYREGRTVYKEDTGRGLFSFLFIYICSLLSFILCSFLPDSFGDLTVVNGIHGALNVYGSMHNTLFGLCLAGVVSCIARKQLR